MKNSTKNAVLMGIFGLFAGCTNENSGGALVFMCLLFIGFYKLYKIKIPKWSLTGAFGALLGAVLLLSAPGNYRISSKADFAELLKRLNDVITKSEILLFALLIIFSVVAILVIISNGFSEEEKSRKTMPAIYILGATASIGVLIFAAMRPERTWFIGICLVITAISYFYTKINFQNLPKALPQITAVLLVLVLGFSVFSEMKMLYGTHEKAYSQLKSINRSIEYDKNSVSVNSVPHSESKHDVMSRHIGILDFGEKVTDWTNAWAAKYFGIGGIARDPNK